MLRQLGKAIFRYQTADERAADRAYSAAVAQARQPTFYAELGVPDTLDGRFEMIVLHIYTIMRRLKRDRAEAGRFSQALYDRLFDDMDKSLREMGAGDLGVAPRVKRMVEAFSGRLSAYDLGVESDEATLRENLKRNLYGTVSPEDWQVAAMARYLLDCLAHLDDQALDGLVAGRVEFPAAPRA